MGGVKTEKQSRKNNPSNKQFYVRRKMLFNKAKELATGFNGVDVAVMVFDKTGGLTEFSSTDMQQILARYRKVSEMREGLTPEVEIKQAEDGFVDCVDTVSEEASSSKVNLNIRGLYGKKDFTNVNSQELRTNDPQFNDTFLAIIENKQKMLIQHQEKFRIQLPKVVKKEISKLVVQQLSLLSKVFTSSMPSQGIVKLQEGLIEGLLSIWDKKQLEQFSTQEPKVVDSSLSFLTEQIKEPKVVDSSLSFLTEQIKEPKVVDSLKKEISNIVSSLLDEDLLCIVFTQELSMLVRGLHDGLLSIWQQMLTHHEVMNNAHLELSRMKVRRMLLKNTETLRGKANVLQGSSGSATDVADTNLCLGHRLSSRTKRKMPDGKTPASDKRFKLGK